VALRLAREGTERFPDEAQIWSSYAVLLQAANQPAESIAALTRVIAIDPAFPNAYLRRGQAYLDSFQLDLAIADLRNAARNGDGDNAARLLSNLASTLYLQPPPATPNYAEAEKLLTPTLEFATAADLRKQLSFLLGYSVYMQVPAMLQARPTDISTRRRALEMVRRALPLIQGSGHESEAQIVDGLNQYIERLQAALQGQ
jgi:tetratricopeptide (TPR) repeat protein